MSNFDAIAARFNKSRYRGLSKDEKRLIKLAEQKFYLALSVRNTYRSGKFKYGNNFRKDERFFNDFEKIWEWDQEIDKIATKIAKLEEKLNKSLADVEHLRSQCNRAPGGSF